MRLEPTQVDFELNDPGSGYRFRVVASKDAEFGWSASVEFSSRCFKTPEAAVKHLALSAQEFIRQVKAVKP